MHRLLEAEDACVEQTPGGVFVGLVPEGQTLLGHVDRRPDIFADPLGADPPVIVEQFDIASTVDLAHNVEAARGNGQAAGWDQTTQIGCELAEGLASADLGGGLAVEGGRPIMVVAPMLKRWRFGLYMGQIAELAARPETADPQDRKSTRLNSSHHSISYAVFCL